MTVPPKACDCHVHVFGPALRYRFAPGRAAALARLQGWASVPALFRKILVDNPARLYDF